MLSLTNVIPEEIILIILSQLPCRTLHLIKNLDDRLRGIINKYDLIDKARNYGYPRKEGHCFEYKFDKYEINNFSEKALKLVLDDFYNIELIRGDLIYFTNDKTCIFDGEKIINLGNDYYKDRVNLPKTTKLFPVESAKQILPKEFTTITNGVPINYWEHNDEYNGILGYKWLDYDGEINRIFDYTIWIDITTIRQQLVDNLNCIGTNSTTKFMFNDIEYKVTIGSSYPYDVNKDDIIKFSSCYENTLYH